jgi:hypothetical protein
MNPRQVPKFVGCTVRFAAAGSGVGSLAGTALGPWLYPPRPVGQGTTNGQELALYGGTHLGMQVGLAAGAVTGTLYTRLVRRSRLRRPVADAVPSR